MLKSMPGRVGLRPFVISALSLAMTLSLVCSLAIQRGHAEAAVAASAELVEPLQTGQKAPRFVVRSVDDEPYAFEPQELDRPVLVITFRGGWCPYCNMHLSELHAVMPEIQSLGFDVLFLSGDRPELLYASLKNETQEDIEGLGYRIYSDADAQAAMAFGIAFRVSDRTVNRRHEKGEDIQESSMLRHGILPVPAIFAIDSDGVIAYSFVEADYKVRLPADELLEAVREIVQ
ncbi:redoxin domain-containing protein [Gammaproteobacteria bacterium]|nr:redoxin domain-containing protein [Gammaproteobacteria bacterium]